MKNLVLSSAAALLLATGAARAQSPHTDNTYFSILGGASFDPALRLGDTLNGMDTGYNLGTRLGFGLDGLLPMPGWSAEADLFYNNSGYQRGLQSSHLASTSMMGDLVYHFHTDGPVSVYGGAGLGAVNDRLGGPVHDLSTVFGWQLLGGLEYPVSQDMSLFTEYRYQNAHDANIDGLHGIGNTSNNLSVGLKFSL